MTKISLTKAWERDHPDDEPCPRNNHSAAQVWRRKRGLEVLPAVLAKQEKYEAAMREKRQRQAAEEAEKIARHRATQDRLRPQRQAGMVARVRARKLNQPLWPKH